MPKRTDIKKILIIGSGPIVISQACEFDYSGTQACKALREEGFSVVLVNSNPATIMTDPETADRTYIEPITADIIEKIIEAERPDALLPTLGGQTALNVTVQLAERGVLDRYGVELIGAKIDAIKRAEAREQFKQTMETIGLEVPRAGYAHTLDEAKAIVETIGFPCVIRPSFTLGGTGGGVAYHPEEFERIVKLGLELSMTTEVSVEESVVGWKEFELEVMRDRQDNVVVVCSIENFDPMGVHTGDSITVAPAQTLTDREYQEMRDAAIKIIRAIGVETGGSNIQFAVHPDSGRLLVIEMNPRVSRSSALASKATGFPIAKIAAKLAVGYMLHELANDITKQTPASFEPTIDYVVVKIPRFAFEKFPGADPTLTIQMKSVGETMAIGRTFTEALQKGLRGLEIKKDGWESSGGVFSPDVLRQKLSVPTAERIFYLKDAFAAGISIDEMYELTRIDRWFLRQLYTLTVEEEALRKAAEQMRACADAGAGQGQANAVEVLRRAKQYGFSDRQLARLWGVDEATIRQWRMSWGVMPSYYLVDTCAAEFEAKTPYYYSTYENPMLQLGGKGREPGGGGEQQPVPHAPRPTPQTKRKVMILGGGPNRIGQGIEFDYCCVHAAFALRELGIEVIMVNSNPETVSTDYDTSDKLYFEPVTLEDVLNIVHREQPEGVVVQFGGQTPLNLSTGLAKAGVPILGTNAEAIDIAEDREKFKRLLDELALRQPSSGTAMVLEDAVLTAHSIGYPCLVRPSYVLGGRAMEIVYDDEQLRRFAQKAFEASPGFPVLIDKFLEDAIEVDIDVIGDGKAFVIGGILEHIEEAGIHSGDSAMVLPPHTLTDEIVGDVRAAGIKLAQALKIVGLMNVQCAIKDDAVYILEVNPRASRTVPFVSKAIGVPLAKLATRAMVGLSLREQRFTEEVVPPFLAVKESVFPFSRFAGVDIALGPEMRSTGEVMGIDEDFGKAFLKSQLGAGQLLPRSGTVFVSVKNRDKRAVILVAQRLEELGFNLVATAGTVKALQRYGLHASPVKKIHEGRPNVLDLLKSGQIQLVINTPSGRLPRADEVLIRSAAASLGIPCITTIAGAQASVNGISTWLKRELGVRPIQEYHQMLRSV
ncbi:MAG: carbamoyl phosphate synthase large subunit [Candidatus Omnitrophica bacterium CG11_big_fil_rev_8_21_14_0_20_63_9]|nr:MAG: carbamoyl phosphate synthase large subunit [Candidatus Omnitrophica bacterium CG11_big_fil_rev_8_21_14_0_20_63_9]